jgi:hypothetical protein
MDTKGLQMNAQLLHEGISDMANEINRLKNHIKELEAALIAVPHAHDALRYRFWRDKACSNPIVIAKVLAKATRPEEIDAGIDSLLMQTNNG